MKQNRSKKFTKGLVCTYENTDLRSFFFELDSFSTKEHYHTVKNIYESNNLDYLVHRTGGGGYHFLSPTMISLLGWKFLHAILLDINPKCPMTTLRVQPNKYLNEENYWYNFESNYYNAEPKNNSYEMSIYLNRIFGTKFSGLAEGSIKLVKYPLPLSDYCK